MLTSVFPFLGFLIRHAAIVACEPNLCHTYSLVISIAMNTPSVCLFSTQLMHKFLCSYCSITRVWLHLTIGIHENVLLYCSHKLVIYIWERLFLKFHVTLLHLLLRLSWNIYPCLYPIFASHAYAYLCFTSTNPCSHVYILWPSDYLHNQIWPWLCVHAHCHIWSLL